MDLWRLYNIDGLVKSRKTDLLPQHIGIIKDDYAICCGQNKMLGLFTRPSILIKVKSRPPLDIKELKNSRREIFTMI